MRVLHTVLFGVLLITSCKQEEGSYRGYELVDEYDGIIVEQFDSTVTDVNRYNHNNKIFKVGTEYTYSYLYMSREGEERLFRFTSTGWEFVDPALSDSTTITSVKIEALSGSQSINHSSSDYKQTVLSYRLVPQINYSTSGVIENEANLWMHPPRDQLFRILEMNPFPYVKFPLEKGNQWSWKLAFGSHWSDERWLTWEGNRENQIVYTVVEKSTRSTKWGEFLCYEIEAKATSDLGETKLTSVFNEEVGFLELNYVNIDGSRIKFELVEKTASVDKLLPLPGQL